ncbi:MAG: hypothetical protein FH761_10090 [Firmicutes bacterium]|nr:hypothetical protein [Bacillota bacterium]
MNIRYYIISIISIFLALGIGMFIGFMFDAQELLTSEKEDMVEKLELKFENLQTENKEVNTKLNNALEKNRQYIDFTESILPELVENRLLGINIVVIETNNDYSYSDVTSILQLSGANVNKITLVDKNIINNMSFLKSQLFDADSNLDDSEVIQAIIPEFVNDIVNNRVSLMLNQIKKRNLVMVEGSTLENTDYFIVAGGAKKDNVHKSHTINNTIVDYLMINNYPLIAIEKDYVKSSFTQNYQDRKIDTINNINTAMGKASLVLILENNILNSKIQSTIERE